MNYYPFHLGDYSAHTGHLDFLEDLAYRRLLDFYYLHESPLPLDVSKLAKLIRMPDEAACVRDVLNEFFYQSEDGFRHTRCDQELEKMKDKQAKARASAQASVSARRTNAQRTLNERSTDVKLPTPIPTPKPNKDKSSVVVKPDGVSDSVWQEFCAHRISRKAKVTKLVIDGISSEATKAGWTLEDALREIIIRNWQSFKAEWVMNKAFAFQANKPNGLAGAI